MQEWEAAFEHARSRESAFFLSLFDGSVYLFIGGLTGYNNRVQQVHMIEAKKNAVNKKNSSWTITSMAVLNPTLPWQC